jgi:hypothetical protein
MYREGIDTVMNRPRITTETDSQTRPPQIALNRPKISGVFGGLMRGISGGLWIRQRDPVGVK